MGSIPRRGADSIIFFIPVILEAASALVAHPYQIKLNGISPLAAWMQRQLLRIDLSARAGVGFEGQWNENIR